MKAQHQILGNLRENKEDWYYLCNDAEQSLIKVKDNCKNEAAKKSIERMILDLNNIRMEQYKALTEYVLVEDKYSEPIEYSITVYQIKDIGNCSYAFRDFEDAKYKINMNDYDKVASIVLPKPNGPITNLLDDVFRLGNTDKDAFTTYGKFRSISVSDILEVDNDVYYVDAFGFKKIN